jgi:hypothetical protein
MKKILFLIPLLLFMFSVMPVHAVWLEGSIQCRDKIITETSGISVIDKPLEFVIYGLDGKLSSNADVILVEGKCNEANTTIPFNILSSTSNSVEFRIKRNVTANSVMNFSVYYVNSSVATAPNYPQIATYTESFEGASLNTSFWTEITNDNAGSTSTDYSRYGSKSWKVVTSGSGKYDQIIHNYDSVNGTFRVWLYDAGNSQKTGLMLTAADGDNGVGVISDLNNNNYSIRFKNNYVATNLTRISANNWVKLDIIMNLTELNIYIQNVSVKHDVGSNYIVTTANILSSIFAGTTYMDMYEFFQNVYDNPSQTFTETNGTNVTQSFPVPPLQELSITLDAPSNDSFRDNTSVRLEQTVHRINFTMGYCEYSLDGNPLVNTSCANTTISLPYHGDHSLQLFVSAINLTTDWFTNSSDVLYFSNPSSTQNFSECIEITEYGQYYLQDDIVNSGESECILVSTDNVLIDCQGHVVDGVDSSGTYGMISEGFDNVTVKNCIVSDWYYGMNFATGTDFEFDNVSVSSCTIGGSPSGIFLNGIDDLTMHDSTVYDSISGVLFNVVTNSNFYNNIFRENVEAFTIDSGMSSSNIWNNTFNSTDININVQSPPLNYNDWNNTIGGNYYFLDDGTGFSDTCTANILGFCDTEYVIDSPDNVDYLPLTYNSYAAPDTGFTVEIIYPANASYINIASFDIDWVITRKVNVTITQCNYSIDGAANITLASCENLTSVSFAYGDHRIDFYVTGTNILTNATMFNSSSVNFNNKFVTAPVHHTSAYFFAIMICIVMSLGILLVVFETFYKRDVTLPDIMSVVVVTVILLSIIASILVSVV